MIIRRPLALIVLAYTLGIGANYIFSPGKSIFIWGFVILCVFALINLFVNHSKNFILILLALIIFCVGGIRCEKALLRPDPMDSYENHVVTYSGICMKYQKKEKDFHKLTVKNGSHEYLLHVFGENVNPEDLIGSSITFTGEVQKPSPKRNPGGFDYEMYLKSIGINWIVSCELDDISIAPPSFKENPLNYIYSRLASVKYEFLNETAKYMSKETHGLLSGMLFGSKDDLDENTYENFQKNGIAHILSVSGIHVAIVYAFLFRILGKRNNSITTALIFLFLFAYAFMSEFSPTVIRAALMIGIHIFSRLLTRSYDILTGTSIAALIMLVANPLTILNSGFQLSFLAVFLMAFLIPFCKRYAGRKKIMGVYKERFRDTGGHSLIVNNIDIKEKAVDALLPLLVIQLGMAPFSMYIFNSFSVAGLFVNIPIIAVSGIIIPAGICLIPFTALHLGILSQFVISTGAGLLDILLEIIIKINEFISSMPLSSFNVVSPPGWSLLLFYGVLFLFSSETFRILRHRKINVPWIAVTAIIVIVSLMGSQIPMLTRDDSEIVFVDVGQGDCIHVRTPSGKNLLFDGGGSVDYDVGKKTLLPYLLKNGVKRIDYVFATHLHTDHYQGIKELSKYMDIGSVVTYAGNESKISDLTADSGIKKNDLIFVGKGDRITIEDGVYIDVLYPDKTPEALDSSAGEDDENKNTLFMKVHYGDTSVLVTGDLASEGESLIMDSYADPHGVLDSTILKVGHHGSKYSTSDEFLDAVSPEFAVIQVGKNNYGHPTPEVIEKLENQDIMIYRNDQDGAVMVKHEDGHLKFKRMIGNKQNGI